MSSTHPQPWLHRFAVATALATLGLVVMGGLVTSHGVGMSVPDWPTSYGYNMFALPVSMWLTGGVFQEHTHRLWASSVGILVVALTRWQGGRQAQRPLLIIGLAEIVAGLLLLRLGTQWQGAGHFLSGIGGVVFLAGLIWARNAAAPRPLPALGWVAFGLVQLQGLLGGLRVVLDAQMVGSVRLGTTLGIFHGCLGQAFLAVLFAIALFTSSWWHSDRAMTIASAEAALMRGLILFTTLLIFGQLMIGATMRHQHAGLAIPDFPLAYGKLWPDVSPDAVARYNQQRVEITTANAITPFQIKLQMVHRFLALGILISVGFLVWRTRRHESVRWFAGFWLLLILGQAGLGAWTTWSNKAADVATAHVLVGALSLVTGVLGCIISYRRRTEKPETTCAVAREDLRRESPLSAG